MLLLALLAGLVPQAWSRSLMQAAMPDDDPLALEDPFTQLSEAELAQDWSHRAEPLEEAPGRSGLESTAGGNMLHEHPPTLSERLGGLSQLRETTYVDVQLVGFDGQGQLGAHVSPSAMQRLLEAIPHDEPVRVLHPTPGASHELPITRRFLYQAPAAFVDWNGFTQPAEESAGEFRPVRGTN